MIFLASDEMGLLLNSETRDTKEFELKRSIYNNSFSGTDISSERMKAPNKINEVSRGFQGIMVFCLKQNFICCR